MKEFVLTFHTHFQALVASRNLKKREFKKPVPLKVKIIPVPRALSSSCGTAIRIQSEKDSVEALTDERLMEYLSDLEYDEIFVLQENSKYLKFE